MIIKIHITSKMITQHSDPVSSVKLIITKNG